MVYPPGLVLGERDEFSGACSPAAREQHRQEERKGRRDRHRRQVLDRVVRQVGDRYGPSLAAEVGSTSV